MKRTVRIEETVTYIYEVDVDTETVDEAKDTAIDAVTNTPEEYEIDAISNGYEWTVTNN